MSIQLLNEVLTRQFSSHIHKLILAVIAFRADDTGKYCTTYGGLSAECLLSRRSVAEGVKALINDKHLSIERGRNHACYTVHDRQGMPLSTAQDRQEAHLSTDPEVQEVPLSTGQDRQEVPILEAKSGRRCLSENGKSVKKPNKMQESSVRVAGGAHVHEVPLSKGGGGRGGCASVPVAGTCTEAGTEQDQQLSTHPPLRKGGGTQGEGKTNAKKTSAKKVEKPLKNIIPPPYEAFREYGLSIGLSLREVQSSFDYWESIAWKRAQGLMKDWQATLRVRKAQLEERNGVLPPQKVLTAAEIAAKESREASAKRFEGKSLEELERMLVTDKLKPKT